MKILSYRSYDGKNIYSYQPVIKAVIDLGKWAGVLTPAIPGFAEKLLEIIPSLEEHHCSRGVPGGFAARMKEGTLLGHVIEHVSLELQHLAGMKVVYGKTRATETKGVYEVVVEYGVREAGFCAVKRAVHIVQAVLDGRAVDVRSEVEAIKEVAAKNDLGPSTRAIAKAARTRGIPVMRLGEGSILQLGYGCFQKKVEATITENTGCIGVDIAGNKALTKELLAGAGIPVPWGEVVRTEHETLRTAAKIQDAVVVKPLNGNQGQGVALDLRSDGEIKRAFAVAQSLDERVIVEKYITGRHYRLVVVGDRVIAGAEKFPACVVGDGVHTIKELVEAENRNPLRGKGHEKPLTRIKIDPVVVMVLAKQNLTPDGVPRAGQKVLLRESANLSTGGTARDVTDLIHPENAALARRAARIIGLDVAGIDLVASDIAAPLDGSNGAVIEVNAAPGLRMHLFPSEGKPRNVGAAVVETLFPPQSRSRIPILSITGTNGKTTCTRLASFILEKASFSVGMTTTDGIYIQGKKIMAGDCTGPASARAVLRDPSVEAAVLETARGGIIRSGLGYDYSDVGIVTNISADHLGQDGVESMEDLAFVKALVVEAVKPDGTAVLNADDKYSLRLAGRVRGKVVYFSLAGDNLVIRRHLGAGGEAVFVRNGFIIYAQGSRAHKIVSVKAAPLTINGLAAHNVQNVLAATAGCLGLGVSIESIREGLLAFWPDLVHNPGRLNMLDIGGIRVVVDYGHNAAGYASILRMFKKESDRQLIGVIGVPGDRLDETIREAGKVAGKGFDYVVIKEDSDLRGRVSGEVANLLREGAMAAGLAAKKINLCRQETKAVAKALEMASPGDTVIIFYEQLNQVMEVLMSYADTKKTSAAEKQEISRKKGAG